MTYQEILERVYTARCALLTSRELPNEIMINVGVDLANLEREIRKELTGEDDDPLRDANTRDRAIAERAAGFLGCTTLNLDEGAELAVEEANHLAELLTEGERIFRKQSPPEAEVEWLGRVRNVLWSRKEKQEKADGNF